MKTNLNRQSDCDIFLNRLENTAGSIGECVDSIFNEKKTKINVLNNVFKLGYSLTKLTLGTAGCIVKNTPKAIVAISSIKRDITVEIESEWNKHQKQLKEDALRRKIKQLKRVN